MGIFGTSKSEEEQLRLAVNNSKTSHPTNRLGLSVSVAQSNYTTDGGQSFHTAGTSSVASFSTVQNSQPASSAQSFFSAADLLDAPTANEPAHDDLTIAATPHLNKEQKQAFASASGRASRSSSEHPPLEHAPAAVPVHAKDLDWDLPDDPCNPQNWPKWKKWYITVTTAIVCLCCCLGLSLYVAATFDLMRRFNASQELCLSGLTFYLIGLAFGPMILAPLSEVVGRRWVYLVTLPILILFTMGVGLLENMASILVLRFFAGYASLPALSIAGGTIGDLWANDPFDMSLAMTIFCLAPFLGPVIGPVIGGYAVENKGWKWLAAWILIMFSGFILPFVVLCPETYKPIILRKRAKARGIALVHEPFTSAKFKAIANYILFLPIKMLFTDAIVLVMLIYIAFVFAVLFGFFEAYPVIFRGTYDMTLGDLGLPFIGVGLGLCLGVLFYAMLDRYYFFKKKPDGSRLNFDGNGNIVWDPPERKLLAGKIGAVCLPVSLFWMGWTARRSVHWMAPTAAGVPFGFGLILVFFAVVLYLGMSFPPMYVALALGAINFLRYIIASVFPLFTVQMYQRLGTGWALSVFAFIALAMVPVPFVYERYGPQLRARSKFGYAEYFRQVAAKAKAEAQAKADAAAETSGLDKALDEEDSEKVPVGSVSSANDLVDAARMA